MPSKPEKNGRSDERARELEVLFEAQNRSGGKHTTSIPATYLRVTSWSE
jgi:hypothetical protein